jgi:hypothetical protein
MIHAYALRVYGEQSDTSQPFAEEIEDLKEALKEQSRERVPLEWGTPLFVFINRRHSRLKILYFDGTGLWLLCCRSKGSMPAFQLDLNPCRGNFC